MLHQAEISTARVRTLRKTPTDAEKALWQRLRASQACGAKFRRQHAFENFILDFVSLDAMLVIEVDGGQQVERAAYDAKRSALIEKAGFVVLRFWNDDVLLKIDDVMERIFLVVEERLGVVAKSDPSPP
jgi:very-short-patch-repair endonuclease